MAKEVKKPTRKHLTVNRSLAARVLKVVDAGLSRGMGEERPGYMCIEAAVCYAMGLPHSDDPPCVAESVRYLKIALNDHDAWETHDEYGNENDAQARAEGLRRIAIAQLGSNTLSDLKFLKRLVPAARKFIGKHKDRAEYLVAFERKLQEVGDDETPAEFAGDLLDAFMVIFNYANRKEIIALANAVAKILVQMGSPGGEFMDLLEG